MTFKQTYKENPNLVKIKKKYRAPQYVYIVDSSMKYCLVLQKCKGNTPLFIDGNTQTLHIDESYVLVNNKKVAPCYIYKATYATYILLTVICKLNNTQRTHCCVFTDTKVAQNTTALPTKYAA